jgi:hypothetical protein
MNKETLQGGTYIDDTKNLAKVIEILGSHYEEAKNFYWSTFLVFHINRQDTEIEKLRKLFVVANRERRGFSEKSLGEAVSKFSLEIEEKIQEIKDKEPSEAHLDFLLWLCSIPHTEQKTANLFLKWVVMFAKELELESLDWVSWRKHCDVPLDRWVLRILGENLQVGSPLFHRDFLNPNSSWNLLKGAGFRKYLQLQKELEQAASNTNQPKIVLDELWLVGHVFDIYRPWLCSQCWIKDQCQYEGKPHIKNI